MATLGNWGEEWALRLQGEMGCKRSRFARGERLKEVMVVGGKRGSRLQVRPEVQGSWLLLSQLSLQVQGLQIQEKCELQVPPPRLPPAARNKQVVVSSLSSWPKLLKSSTAVSKQSSRAVSRESSKAMSEQSSRAVSERSSRAVSEELVRAMSRLHRPCFFPPKSCGLNSYVQAPRALLQPPRAMATKAGVGCNAVPCTHHDDCCIAS